MSLDLGELLRVDLHEQLERVVNHAVDSSVISNQARRSSHSPVPVLLRIGVKRWEDKRQNDAHVLAHEVDNVLVVPVVKRTLSNLTSA